MLYLCTLFVRFFVSCNFVRGLSLGPWWGYLCTPGCGSAPAEGGTVVSSGLPEVSLSRADPGGPLGVDSDHTPPRGSGSGFGFLRGCVSCMHAAGASLRAAVSLELPGPPAQSCSCLSPRAQSGLCLALPFIHVAYSWLKSLDFGDFSLLAGRESLSPPAPGRQP